MALHIRQKLGNSILGRTRSMLPYLQPEIFVHGRYSKWIHLIARSSITMHSPTCSPTFSTEKRPPCQITSAQRLQHHQWTSSSRLYPMKGFNRMCHSNHHDTSKFSTLLRVHSSKQRERLSYILGSFRNSMCSRQYSTVKSESETAIDGESVPSTLGQSPASRVPVQSLPKEVKKTRRLVKKPTTEDYEATAYCCADSINIAKLREDLLQDDVYEVIDMPADANDVVVAKIRSYSLQEVDGDMFFFKDGSTVFWNVPKGRAELVLIKLGDFLEDRRYDMHTVNEEEDSLPYCYTPEETVYEKGGTLRLKKPENDEELMNCYLEKYAISKPLDLSVKLAMMEKHQDDIADKIKPMNDKMKTGIMPASKSNALTAYRLTAEIINLRHQLKQSDLTDTPDFFWDRDALEKNLYEPGRREFQLDKRVKVMELQVEHCLDILQNITATHTDSKHLRLERIIIWLIFIEVFIEVGKWYFEK